MAAAKDLYQMAGKKAPQYNYGEEAFGVAPDNCPATTPEVRKAWEGVYDALCDDLNTPIALANISEAVRIINSAKSGSLKLSKEDLAALTQLFDDVVFGVLGLKDEADNGTSGKIIEGLMQMVLEQRAAAKAAKDWTTSDHIRDSLKALGIQVKDGKDGAEWTIE